MGKVIRIISDKNTVIFHNYTKGVNETFELDLAEKIFKPLFKIAEVAKFFGKKPDTIRKWEYAGKIPKAKQFYLNSDRTYKIRLYSWNDILEMADHVGKIRPVGRPSELNVPRKIYLDGLKKEISKKIEKEK